MDEPTPPSSNPPPYPSENTAAEPEKFENTEAKSTVSQATTAVTTAAQATYEELKNKLAQAEAQIAALKETGLRQRNVKTSDNDEKRPLAGTAQAVRQTVEGVPVQMVAILCLVSFLLAYFFF